MSKNGYFTESAGAHVVSMDVDTNTAILTRIRFTFVYLFITFSTGPSCKNMILKSSYLDQYFKNGV